MNYEKINLPTGQAWGVVEKATGHLIRQYADGDRAMKLCQFLNNGGGFNGWTPGFLCDRAHYALYNGKHKNYKTFTVL